MIVVRGMPTVPSNINHREALMAICNIIDDPYRSGEEYERIRTTTAA